MVSGIALRKYELPAARSGGPAHQSSESPSRTVSLVHRLATVAASIRHPRMREALHREFKEK
jgi:hypothetical protein